MSDNPEDAHLRNAAGRLYLFLRYWNGQPTNESNLSAICNYFQIPAVYNPAFFSTLAELYGQPQVMEEEIQSLVDSAVPIEELLEPLPQVKAALDNIVQNPGGSSNDGRTQYNDGTLRMLRTASHLVNNAAGFKEPVSEDALERVRQSADDLIQFLTEDADIEPGLRDILYRYTEGVRRSVDLYKIGGLDVVITEFDKFTGALFIRQPENAVKVMAKPKLREKVSAVLLTLNIIASAGNAAVAIEQGAEAMRELTATPTSVVAPAAQVNESA